MKLIILDRDGVINFDSDQFIKNPDEWIPIPGSLEAIAKLNENGYQVAVATNQSGLARGYMDEPVLRSIHEKMNQALAEVGGKIDYLRYCPHGPDDQCNCRKPKAGMLEAISKFFSTDLSGVPAVGDSIRDLQAAQTVGADPILVRTGKGERSLQDPQLDPSIPVYDDLAQFVNQLCP